MKKQYICKKKEENMETTVKIPASFNFDEALLAKLKEKAKEYNCSLNTYVERLLFDAVYNEPNEVTQEAIKEAQRGEYAGVLDMNDIDSFVKSIEND